MRVLYHAKFIRLLHKAPQYIQLAAKTRIDLFSSNPHHPLLRNHRLAGQYEGCRSINITGDWRAIYYESEPVIDEPSAIFFDFGTHSQLYC